MVSDTTDFVRECETCIKNRKKSNENTAFLNPLEAPEGPLQEISTDIFGPLIAQDNTKKYVLTIVDQWSRHCEFVILPNKSAEQVANSVKKEIGERFKKCRLAKTLFISCMYLFKFNLSIHFTSK